MRRFVILLTLMLPFAVQGEEVPWAPLGGPEIRTALEGRTLHYRAARQDFNASGRTRYVASRESWGYWRIEDDQYCSQWPPSTFWACYDMTRRGDALRFIGKEGDVTEGSYAD